MATKTLSQLVTDVRAEAGHALAAYQGLNALESLKHEIRRTQEELWTAFQWPTLKMRVDIPLHDGQYLYAYPTDMQFDQIRKVYYAPENGTAFYEVQYGIPETCILPGGDNSTRGVHAQFWEDGNPDSVFRIWPTPSNHGTIRLTGMRPLAPLVDDDDRCTLDATCITLFAAKELLLRAKASDAESKAQKAQRHLLKLLADKVSAKNKVSLFGAGRPYDRGPRPYIDYIPGR
jgi:hypothetical protein